MDRSQRFADSDEKRTEITPSRLGLGIRQETMGDVFGWSFFIVLQTKMSI